MLQTGNHTSHDSIFRWNKCFNEARTKTVLSSHCTYNMFLHILKGKCIKLFIYTMCLGINIGSFSLVFTFERKYKNDTTRFNCNRPKKSTCHHIYTRPGTGSHIQPIVLSKKKILRFFLNDGRPHQQSIYFNLIL